jgi:hypothetical protein
MRLAPLSSGRRSAVRAGTSTTNSDEEPMQWDLRFKGLGEDTRTAHMLARWRSRLERQLKGFASDRVSLRGLVERHSNKRRFQAMLLLSVPGRVIVERKMVRP